MQSKRGFGVKNRNFGGFSSDKEVPKTNFYTEAIKLPYNLGK